MPDYYPEFYRQRRQREQAYRRATVVIGGFLLLVVVGGLVGYFIWNNFFAVRRTAPGASPELAQQQQELQTEQRIASNRVPSTLLAEGEAQEPVDLKSISYGESLPQVSVSLEGAETTAPGAVPVEEPAAAEVTDPEAAAEDDVAGDPAETGDAPPADPAAATTPPADPRVERVSPDSADELAKKAEEQRKKDAARREAEKRDKAKKEAAEKRKRDEQLAAQKKKDEEKKAEPKAEPKKEQAAAKSAPDYVYTVYAGSYLSRDEAEKARGNLSALGLSGSVIDANTGDYLVMVGRVDSMDQAEALKSKLAGGVFGGAFVTRKVEK
jgi:hypothetical protein